jgi:hypothetical protein
VAAVYRERAAAKRKLRQPRAALDDYAEALRLEPTSETYASRGWVYLELNSPPLARAEFDEAIRLDPGNGDAHAGRAYTLVTAGEVDEAVREARRALDLGRPREALAGDARAAREKARLAYNVARVYAQAAGRLDVGPARLAYQVRAVQLVRLALARTPAAEQPQFWREYVEADRALGPVRRSPEFLRLAAEYPPPAG